VRPYSTQSSSGILTISAIQQDFFIPSKAHNLIFVRKKIAVLCKKGFEVMDFSESVVRTFPITN
jgi:hypothetical protein